MGHFMPSANAKTIFPEIIYRQNFSLTSIAWYDNIETEFNSYRILSFGTIFHNERTKYNGKQSYLNLNRRNEA